MKKSLKELRELLAAKQNELRGLKELQDTENRDFTKEEDQKVTGLLDEIDGLMASIRTAERLEENSKRIAEERAKKDRSSNDELPREIRQYSVLKAIRSSMEGRLEGLELEMHQEGIEELRKAGASPEGRGVIIPAAVLRARPAFAENRDMTVTGGTSGDQGGVTVATEIGTFIDYLRNQSILRQAGAQVLTNLTGNIDFPIGVTDATVTWEGETDANAESNPTMSKRSISPKRLGTFIDVSRQLLLQSSSDVEALVIRMLLDNVVLGWESAAINGDGSGKPLGILGTSGIGSVVGGTNGGEINWTRTVALETAVRVANAAAARMAYITNEKVRGYWKTTPKVSSTAGMIWSDVNNEAPVNNYPVLTSGLIPSTLTKGSSSSVCSAAIFGDFSKLLLAQWGGLEVFPDPYSRSKEGLVVMLSNAYVDSLVLQPKSFAAMVDITIP